MRRDRGGRETEAAPNQAFGGEAGERVTIVFPASYGIRDWGYRLARVQTQPREVPRAAMQEIGRFNR